VLGDRAGDRCGGPDLAYCLVRTAFVRWRVLDSNQRRLCRRFTGRPRNAADLGRCRAEGQLARVCATDGWTWPWTTEDSWTPRLCGRWLSGGSTDGAYAGQGAEGVGPGDGLVVLQGGQFELGPIRGPVGTRSAPGPLRLPCPWLRGDHQVVAGVALSWPADAGSRGAGVLGARRPVGSCGLLWSRRSGRAGAASWSNDELFEWRRQIVIFGRPMTDGEEVDNTFNF